MECDADTRRHDRSEQLQRTSVTSYVRVRTVRCISLHPRRISLTRPLHRLRSPIGGKPHCLCCDPMHTLCRSRRARRWSRADVHAQELSGTGCAIA